MLSMMILTTIAVIIGSVISDNIIMPRINVLSDLEQIKIKRRIKWILIIVFIMYIIVPFKLGLFYSDASIYDEVVTTVYLIIMVCGIDTYFSIKSKPKLDTKDN